MSLAVKYLECFRCGSATWEWRSFVPKFSKTGKVVKVRSKCIVRHLPWLRNIMIVSGLLRKESDG